MSFAAPDTLYFGYGRFFFLVYVLIILGLIALHRAQIQRVAQQRPLAQRAYLVLLVSLMVAALLMPATFFDRILVHYAPNAQLLPFAVVWPIVGVYLLASGHSGSILSGGQIGSH